MLLADGTVPDLLAPLYSQWPWMVIVIAVSKWLATIGEKVVARHVSFVDEVSNRETSRLDTDKQLAVALSSIAEELRDHGVQLNTIRDKPLDCPMRNAGPCPMQVQTLQPT